MQKGTVLTGLDVELENNCPVLRDQKVGLICNHTTISGGGQHAVDALEQMGVNIVRLFGPEHGVRGDVAAGEKIDSGIDAQSGIPQVSLYGEKRRPDAEDLRNLDCLVYDIQDLGVRFYTYIWTLRECMEAAAEHNVPFVLLDRPGIVGPAIEGNVLEMEFSSFVGQRPVAWRYGLTSGELALLYNQMGWVGEGKHAELTVLKSRGYSRTMWQEDTGLPWVAPSPNIPTPETAVHYPGTCLFEGTSTVTEARGTDKPFQYVGSSYIDGRALADRMNGYGLEGVQFEPVEFVPKSIPGKANKPKFEGKKCEGVELVCTDRGKYRPATSCIALLEALLEMYPGKVLFREAHFDHLAGTDKVRKDIIAQKPYREIIAEMESTLSEFLALREKILIY